LSDLLLHMARANEWMTNNPYYIVPRGIREIVMDHFTFVLNRTCNLLYKFKDVLVI
jgi:hypothetical protein